MSFEDDLGWEYFGADPMTSPRMMEHMDWHAAPENRARTGAYGERFLTFHQQFIAKFDDFRHTKGLIPVSAWDPSTPIPDSLSHDHVLTAGRDTNYPYSVNSNCKTPTWATIAGGSDTDPLYGHTQLAQFHSLDELGRAIDAGWHGTVHNTIGGDMAAFHSPIDPIFWRWHHWVDGIRAAWETTTHVRLGREFAEVSRILFGVAGDGGGAVLSGGSIVPVPPRSPEIAASHALSPELREVVLGHMLKKMGGLFQSRDARTDVAGLASKLIGKAAERLNY